MAFYDNDYNRKLASSLQSINYALSKQDELTPATNYLKGGVRGREREYVKDLESFGKSTYIKHGTSPNYPFLNMTELDMTNRSTVNPLLYQRPAGMKGGFSWSDVGNFLKPIASTALDALVPVASVYTGMPTAVSAVRGAIKGATGVGLKKRGRKPKVISGVGTYESSGMNGSAKSGGCCGSGAGKLSAGAMSGGAKKRGRKAKVEPSSNRKELIKSVMKDMGLKMTDASKYIKENGLYKKS